MGTKATMAQKHKIANKYLEQAIQEQKDLDKEKFIAVIMNDCLCERRKAVELVNSKIKLFGVSEARENGHKIIKVAERRLN